MLTRADFIPSQARSGFTLLEVLLVVAVMLLLLGAVVFNFSNLQRGAKLEEGSAQFESLIVFARAHAAHTGRRVRMVFNEIKSEHWASPSGTLRLQWEPDPLSRPGQFELLSEAASFVNSLQDLVRVEKVRALGLEPERESDDFTDQTPAMIALQPINFFPDGSSDTVELVLASLDENDDRLATARLSGVTGTLRWSISRGSEMLPAPDAESKKARTNLVETAL